MVFTCPLIIIITVAPFRVFHTSVNRWFLNRVWGRASLLSILADLNNAIVWMVSIRSLISKTSSPFTSPLVFVLWAPITIGITVTFMVHSFFNSITRSGNLSFFSLSFNFTLWSTGTAKSAILLVLFFLNLLLQGLVVWLRLGNRLNRKIPVEFVRLILQDGFWVMNILFVRTVKFKFLAQFPMEHLIAEIWVIASLLWFPEAF